MRGYEQMSFEQGVFRVLLRKCYLMGGWSSFRARMDHNGTRTTRGQKNGKIRENCERALLKLYQTGVDHHSFVFLLHYSCLSDGPRRIFKGLCAAGDEIFKYGSPEGLT